MFVYVLFFHRRSAASPANPEPSRSSVPGSGVTVTVPPATENSTDTGSWKKPGVNARPPSGKPLPTDGSTVLIPGARASKVRLKRSIVTPAPIGPSVNGEPKACIPKPSLPAVKGAGIGKGRPLGVKGRPGTTNAAPNRSAIRGEGTVPAMLPAVGDPVPPAKPRTAPRSLKTTSKAKVSNTAVPSPVYTTSIVKTSPGSTVNMVCIPAVPGSKSTDMMGNADAVVVLKSRNAAIIDSRISNGYPFSNLLCYEVCDLMAPLSSWKHEDVEP